LPNIAYEAFACSYIVHRRLDTVSLCFNEGGSLGKGCQTTVWFSTMTLVRYFGGYFFGYF